MERFNKAKVLGVVRCLAGWVACLFWVVSLLTRSWNKIIQGRKFGSQQKDEDIEKAVANDDGAPAAGQRAGMDPAQPCSTCNKLMEDWLGNPDIITLLLQSTKMQEPGFETSNHDVGRTRSEICRPP